MEPNNNFIAIVGQTGVGKSTLARALAEQLETLGHEVVLTREPGGSQGAEEIRALLTQADPDRFSPKAALHLLLAAREDHVSQVIQPALGLGKIVICDGFELTDHWFFAKYGIPILNDVITRYHAFAAHPRPSYLVLETTIAIAERRVQARSQSTQRLDWSDVHVFARPLSLHSFDYREGGFTKVDNNGTIEESVKQALAALGVTIPA